MITTAIRRARNFAVCGMTVSDDFTTRRPDQALATALLWISATRLRRVICWPILVFQLAVAVSTLFAPNAAAATSTAAVDWMGIKDSKGVNLANYQFSTDGGSLFHPINSGTSTFIQAEFGIWLIMVTTAVWFVCWALSFNWLNLIAEPVRSISDALTQTLSTPVILSLAGTLAAIPVAYFLLRGNFAKGATQICVIMAIGVLGGSLFADPVADVMGSNGLLAQGRDAGMSVAASITGDSSANATNTISTIETQLADSFGRHPLQQWNFGTVVDNVSPACSAAWTAGARSGDADNIKDGIADCGAPSSKAMKKIADNPSGGQIGTGAALLLGSLVLLAFGCFYGGLIIKTAVEAIYYAIRGLVGFLVTGFIYGPTQQALWYSIIDACLSAVAMCVYVIFLAIYTLVLDRIFTNPNMNGIAVIFIGGIMMIIGIGILHKIRKSLRGATDRSAARLNAAISGGPGTAPKPVGEIGTGYATHALNAMQMANNRMRSGADTRSAGAAVPTDDARSLPKPKWGDAQGDGEHHYVSKIGHAATTAATVASYAVPGGGEAVAALKATQKAQKARAVVATAHRAAETAQKVGAGVQHTRDIAASGHAMATPPRSTTPAPAPSNAPTQAMRPPAGTHPQAWSAVPVDPQAHLTRDVTVPADGPTPATFDSYELAATPPAAADDLPVDPPRHAQQVAQDPPPWRDPEVPPAQDSAPPRVEPAASPARAATPWGARTVNNPLSSDNDMSPVTYQNNSLPEGGND